jgi:hypothetical protein
MNGAANLFLKCIYHCRHICGGSLNRGKRLFGSA